VNQRQRRLLPLAVTLLLAGAPLTLLPTTAHAVDCDSELQLFGEESGSGFTRRGTYTENMIRDANIDAACQGVSYSLRHSTAYMDAPNLVDQMEIGWQESWSGQTHVFKIFWEYVINGVPYGPFFKTGYACCRWSNFKVYHVSGTTWKAFFDYNQDGIQEWTTGEISIPNMTAAEPEAETTRRGGGSNYDHHNNLKYRDSGGTWHSWDSNIREDPETDPGYHCHKDAANEYEFHTPDTPHVPSSPYYCLP
jgi:hypothetical protein